MTDGESPSRSRLSGEQRRDQIVSAAHRVFARHGMAGARTRDIAIEAGVTEALVYQHFRSKGALFEAVLVSALEEAEARLEADLQQATQERQHDASEVKLLMTRQVRQLLLAFQGIEPLLGVVIYGDDDAAARHFRTRLQNYLDDTRRSLVAFLPYWAHRDFDADLAVEALIGIVWTRVLVARMTGRGIDVDTEAQAVAEMLLDGLRKR